MKTLTALFTAAALTLTAGLAQADVRVDQIPQLVKEGKIKSLESMNAEALKLHPGATITDTDLDNHFNGYEYEVELVTPQGVVREIKFDARTGVLIKDEEDD